MKLTKNVQKKLKELEQTQRFWGKVAVIECENAKKYKKN